MENLTGAVSDWAQHAQKNAGRLIAFGVVTVIAGFLAVVAPLAGGLWVTAVVGIALTIGGASRIVHAFGARSFGQGTLGFIGGVLAVVAGVLLVTRPGFGLATLTLVLGAYLLVDGVTGIVLAFHVRPVPGWGWMLFSAAMGALLGVLLLAQWPISGLWAVGTLVGISLLFAGTSMISIGSAARRVLRQAA